MRKNILNKLVFVVTLFIFTNTNTVQAQPGNAITISVNEIKYDDPNFTALRESLKKNSKVKSVKPSYKEGVAILSFMYAGEASQLWEEIPKTAKRFFELAGMNSDAITLTYLNPKKNEGHSTAETSSTQTKNNNKKDCFDCAYFPLCKSDKTITYGGGHVYKGIRESDESMSYYNCENGIVTKKWVTSSSTLYMARDYDIFTDTQTDIYYEGRPVYTRHTKIILKSDAPEGTIWEDDGSRLSIKKKDTSVTVAGVKYDHVIVVYDGTYYKFYAKGFGLILDINYSQYNRQINEAIISKGITDPDLIGRWYEDKGRREYYFDAKGWETPTYSFSSNYIKWSVIDNKLYTLKEDDLLVHKLIKSLPSITIDGIKYNRTEWKDPKIDTALNRQLIESRNFRFVAQTVKFPYPALPRGAGKDKEFVIKNDSIGVFLPRDENGEVIQFVSSNIKYSIEYGSSSAGYKKITILAKDKKENFEFKLEKYGNHNRDATLKVQFGNRHIAYIGYITDLNGN